MTDSNVIYADFSNTEPLLSKAELAERLGCSPRYIERLIAEGAPHKVKGVRKMFKETAVRNWIARRDLQGAAHAR